MSPGVRRKPHRQCQKCEQRYDKDRDRNEIAYALRQMVGLKRADAGRCAGEESGGFVFSRGHDWLLRFGLSPLLTLYASVTCNMRSGGPRDNPQRFERIFQSFRTMRKSA